MQVISNLHKQNFDLKLELYHRRERQTALEDRVEILEMEKNNAQDMNNHLVQEMDKRDKAVEEAVAMIVTLEARLEQFAQERAMVEQIEADRQYSSHNLDLSYQIPPSRATTPDFQRQNGDVKVINRMPSFLSEQSENTENLRNVYLGARGSVLSLPQVPEASGDADQANVLGSPCLSVLSESSFVSVYGKKGRSASTSHEIDEPLCLDGTDSYPSHASTISRPKTSIALTPSASRRTRSNSLSTSRQSQFQSITDVIDQDSPLQKIERLDRTYSQQKRAEEHPQSQDNDTAAAFTGRAAQSPNHRRAREERRESLRKVVTDAPGGVRLHDHTLPPTPDTISTSTLRRFQNSNDTLSKGPALRRSSHGTLSDTTDHNEKLWERDSGASLIEPSRHMKASARITELNNSAYLENQARMIQRPRSADETTISNRRANDWDTDTDDSDVDSLESSLDIWMRESAVPAQDGRASPDLFSFPINAAKRDWAADGMFVGPGNGYIGGVSAGVDQHVLDLFPIQQELFSSSIPPPTPNRRSSLHAQMGTGPRGSPPVKLSPKDKVSKPSRRTRYRRNSDTAQLRAEVQKHIHQPPNVSAPSDDVKKNHYPPISGQQAVRNGITKLFRRSLGGAPSTDAPAPTGSPVPESSAIEPLSSEPIKLNGPIGIPSWVSRSAAVEDDRESATPPPIMRNPRRARNISLEVSVPDDSVMNQEPMTPSTPMAGGDPEYLESSPRVPSASGARRKWLTGFGRSTGLRTKTG